MVFSLWWLPGDFFPKRIPAVPDSASFFGEVGQILGYRRVLIF